MVVVLAAQLVQHVAEHVAREPRGFGSLRREQRHQLRAQRAGHAPIAVRGVARVGARRVSAQQLAFEHTRIQQPRAAGTADSVDQQRAAVAAHEGEHAAANADQGFLATDQRGHRQVRARHVAEFFDRQIGDRAEPLHDFRGTLRPCSAIERQQLQDQVTQRRGDFRHQTRGRRGPRAPGVAQVVQFASRVGVPPRHQVIRQRAQRKQICACIQRLHLQHFGCHERRRADHVARDSDRRHRAEVDQSVCRDHRSCVCTLPADTSRCSSPRQCKIASDDATSRSSAQASRHGSCPVLSRSEPSSSSIV